MMRRNWTVWWIAALGMAINLAWPGMAWPGDADAQLRYTHEGQTRLRTPEVVAAHVNPWPIPREQEFWDRLQLMFIGGNDEDALLWADDDVPGGRDTLEGVVRRYGLYRGEQVETAERAAAKKLIDRGNTSVLRTTPAAYLLAEAAGDAATTARLANAVHRIARAAFDSGLIETTSPADHVTLYMAYLNLYDFAEDQRVVGHAKAVLDYLAAAAAVRYYRAATLPMFYPYFGVGKGATLMRQPKYGYIATSTYRPPMAVVRLAQKKIDWPYELLRRHPDGALETSYAANTHQFGSVATVTDNPRAEFTITMRRGAGRTDRVPFVVRPGDVVGQHQYLALWLTGDGDGREFTCVVPKARTFSSLGDAVFIQGELTWIGIVPVNTGGPGLDRVKIEQPKGAPASQTLSFKGKPGAVAGLAVIVGERISHKTFERFKRDVAAIKPVIEGGKVTITDRDLSLAVELPRAADAPPRVWRNGELHNWSKHTGVFQPADGGERPIHLDGEKLRLYVEFGAYKFTGEFNADGDYVSTNTGPSLR